MNLKLKDIFRGKVVNKAHTINTGVDEFPRYVLEYLIDNYCEEATFRDDMEKVVRRLKETFVYGAETEKIRHFIRETGIILSSQTSKSGWSKRRTNIGRRFRPLTKAL